MTLFSPSHFIQAAEISRDRDLNIKRLSKYIERKTARSSFYNVSGKKNSQRKEADLSWKTLSTTPSYREKKECLNSLGKGMSIT